jgi:hypothetical protein
MAIISRSTFNLASGIFGALEEAGLSVFGNNSANIGSVFAPYDVTIINVPNISSRPVGSTFTLNSGPVFSQTVDFLTNGQEGMLIIWLSFAINVNTGAGHGSSKRYFNGGYPAIDLRGFTIEGLDLRLDSFTATQESVAVQITFVIRGKFPWGPLWWHFWPRLSLYRPQ